MEKRKADKWKIGEIGEKGVEKSRDKGGKQIAEERRELEVLCKKKGWIGEE